VDVLDDALIVEVESRGGEQPSHVAMSSSSGHRRYDARLDGAMFRTLRHLDTVGCASGAAMSSGHPSPGGST